MVIAPVAPPPPPPPPPMPTPAPIDFAPPAASPFAPPEPAAPTPAPPPPNTLSRSQPVPDLGATEAVPSFADSSAPPMTMARRGGAAAEPPADAPAEDGAAARFAKPAPPETAQPKPARSNKKFLIAGGVLLTLLLGVTVLFMRQPKDDLKQMASLDDGKPPVGLGAEDQSPAPIVKPRIAEPEPAPAPVPAGPSAEQEAAIAAVKDFPLDGGRGTVGRWLQYSYTASPGAGTEEWNASATAENTTLVEYRFVPAPGGSGKGALYLFELDGIGLVMGKNLEARQMLAGAPPAEAAPVKKAKAPKKKPVKRRPVYEEPKELPQLPLPDSGELRPRPRTTAASAPTPSTAYKAPGFTSY
ncbi:MAG: hypothetical protein M0D55_00825 [Elusimicrobiota bacterium]|nr:MAG: hypothetical protein M0D55_00825 [Elusimicrobiota bacterium]